MSFVISLALACAVVLATFMLQLCDDDLNKSSQLIGVASFVGVALALYFVDYKKKFALSKRACNILVALAVLAQLGTLVKSSQDFIAFAIANILASLQTILFFQSKTLRKCYQIVTIAFVEVAVGCVFQRSSLFVLAAPIFAALGFVCYSLLFLWGERKYYAERVALKNRFVARKNLSLITAEEPLHAPEYKPLDAFDSAAARKFGKRATVGEEPRFFRRPSIFPIRFDGEYFRTFLFGALGAFVVAAVFFCFFPRMDEFGFGFLKFDDVQWSSGRGGAATRTGFKPTIELGDLGPALDSKEVVMNVDLTLCNPEPQRANAALDENSPIYFKGVNLTIYDRKSWSELPASAFVSSTSVLKSMIDRFTLADSDDVLEPVTKRINAQRNSPPPLLFGRQGSRNDPFSYGNAYQAPSLDPAPVLGAPPLSIPNRSAFRNAIDQSNRFDDFVELVRKGTVDASQTLYDERNEVVALNIDLNPLDVQTVFLVHPFYVAKARPDLLRTRSASIAKIDFAHDGAVKNGSFWLLSPAFRDGRQDPLVPNQEAVWGCMHQYLQIDADRFPRLIALAKKWDQESNLPYADFVARAKRLESMLRDSGEYVYNRYGVLRNPEVDPLEDFIAEHKQGHCEYFAGALALMLRAVGIPSRVVVGYAAYPAPNGKTTVVRQSDAHSWVEAYIPPHKLPKPDGVSAEFFAGASKTSAGQAAMPKGKDWSGDGAWLRLDATPAAQRDSDRPSALAIGMFKWSNFFRSFGRDFVLNFNTTTQMRAFYEPIRNAYQATVDYLRELRRNFALSVVGDFWRKCRDSVKRAFMGDWTPNLIFALFAQAATIAAVVFFLVKVTRFVVRKIKKTLEYAREEERRRAGRMRAGVAAVFYERLEKYLEARLQTQRKLSETPREFVERCLNADETRDRQNAAQECEPLSNETRALFREIVERYYRARFGNVQTTEEDSKRVERDLQNVGVA